MSSVVGAEAGPTTTGRQSPVAGRCYVYAIVDAGTPLPSGLTGFGAAPLALVACRALAAVTSAVSPASMQPTPERVLHHEAVVETLARNARTIPVRFGTVLPDSGAVADAIAQRYSVLAADLARLGGKIELGLSVLWGEVGPADGVGAMAGPDCPPRPVAGRSATPSAERCPTGRGTAYLAARLEEYRRESSLRSRASSLARDLDRALSPHVLECRHALLPAPRLALTATYLVEPASLGACREAFDRLRQAHPGLCFLLSGPWPPYSFVTPTDVPIP